MSDNNELKKKAENGEDLDHLSLNDDRRVKVLSPGAMVAKRFFRNRIAVVGMATLIFHVPVLLCGRPDYPLQRGPAVLPHGHAE